MSRKLFGLMAGALLLTGCATAALTPAGRKVVAVPSMNTDGCEPLGTVIGQGGGSFGGAYISNDQLMQYAINDAQNKAANLGATHLHMSAPQLGGANGTTTTATVMGTAYRCAVAAQAPAGATPTAASAPAAAPAPATTPAPATATDTAH